MQSDHPESNGARELADAGFASDDGTRRTAILQAATSVIASAGLRTSMQEIADAAGIMAGSLYHHFESKEAILFELVQRYYADLKRIGTVALERVDGPELQPIPERILELGSAIARCAVKHRAALQMSFYEAPSANQALVQLLQDRPTAIQQAMLKILRAGLCRGDIRADVDLVAVADRICQSMMHVGLDVIRDTAAADDVAALLCRIMLHGLADRSRTDEELDGSSAFAAAEEAIRSWSDDSEREANDKAAYVRAVARAEFGRRGYEATTIRDIVAAANLGPGTVYSLIGSKDKLLASIMVSFGRKVGGGVARVLSTDARPIEKLDALCWVNINALDRFPDEWKIQLAWMRQSPPDTPEPGLAFASRMFQLRRLLSEGIRSQDILVDVHSLEMLSRCVMDVLWMPENLVRGIGTRSAIVSARDTVVRGIAQRGRVSEHHPEVCFGGRE